jgi:hypothetical protein
MRSFRVLPLVLVMLVAGPSGADATTVAFRASGTASGNGSVDIIIQDNDQPSRVARAIHEVNIPILAGSTAEQSAQTCQSTLEAELPGFYDVVVYEDNRTVVISQPGAIVDFQISDDVPGQLFKEVAPPGTSGVSAPAVSPVTLGVVACVMTGLAALRLRRRRSETART